MRFNKGINKDVAPSAQPEGTYRDLLNGVINENVGNIQSDDGTQELLSFSKEIIDTLYIDEETTLLFVYDSSNSLSEIISVDLKNGNISGTVLQRSDLDFDQATYFDSTYTRNNRDEVIVYWTDGLNPPRFYNIDQQPSIVSSGDLSLFPRYDSYSIDFTLNSIDSSGGSLEAGSYYLAFAYIDSDQTLTDYFYITQPITILGPSGFGANEDLSTGRSINFTLSNLDNRYEQVRVSSIRGTNVTNVQDIYISDDDSIRYSYSGSEDDTIGSLDEVSINSPVYSKANSLQQQDGNLYMGGLERKDLSRQEKIELQRVALNTSISSVTESYDNHRFYQDPQNCYNKRGFKRGEVYALYLSFILEDGTETEAFHIPGRESIQQGGYSIGTVTLNSFSFPDNSYSEGDQSLGTPPENGDLASAGWEIRDDDGSDISATDSIDDQTITFWVVDDQGNEVISDVTKSIGPNSDEGSSTAGPALQDIKDEIDSYLQTNNLDSDWSTNVSEGTIIEIESQNAGTEYNNYTFDILISNTSNNWREQNGDNTTLSSGSTREEGVFAGGDSNTEYNSDIEISITNDNGDDWTIDVNAALDSDINWGSESPWLGGDDEATIIAKTVAMMNNSQNNTDHDTAFSEIQNAYTFYDDGNDAIRIQADSYGEKWDGELTITDPNGNLRITTNNDSVSILGGYDQDEDGIDFGFSANLESSLDDVEVTLGNVTAFSGDSVNDVVSELTTQAQNNNTNGSDVDISRSGNKIIVKDNTSSTTSNEPSIFSNAGGSSVSTTSDSTYSEESSHNEMDDIESSDPIDSGLKYQVYDNPDSTYNMGFWQNKDELYPSEEPWISEGLDGNNVRHHRLPGSIYNNSPYEPGEGINITGLRVSGIDIQDTDLQGKVVGAKLYYASKDNNDRIILDQGSITNGWLDTSGGGSDVTSDNYLGTRPAQQADNVFAEDILTTHGFDDRAKGNDDDTTYQEIWGSYTEYGYVRPPESILDRLSISGASFVKGIVKVENDHDNVDQTNLVGNSTIITESDKEFAQSIEAKSYVDANQRNINLQSFGFNYDMDNLFGESKIVLEIQNPDGNLDIFDDFGTRGYRVISDICQKQENVHVSFTNQDLVRTDRIIDIDSDGNQLNSTTPTIFGGDIYIGENYFRANTLLSLAEIDEWSGGTSPTDSDEDWWGRESSSNVSTSNESFRNDWLQELSQRLFGNSINYEDAQMVHEASRNNVSGGAENYPIATSTLYKEIVESRINTSILYSGDEEFKSVYPERNTWTDRPNLQELEEDRTPFYIASWWLDNFTNWDNYYQFNDQYKNLANIKTSFPWSPQQISSIDNYNRVIRSAGDDTGRSQSFRQFRENDYIDLPRNRGNVVSLDVLQNNLIIHMDRALIQTRGREELKTRDFEVYLGSGNIFEVKPNELLSTEAGFGGLQDITNKINSEKGYFWVDKEAQRVFQLSNQGLEDLSSQNYGLNNWFNDNLGIEDNIRTGYDPNHRRIMVNNDQWTLSFYPENQIWGSFHDYSPDDYIKTLNDLITVKNNNIYHHDRSSNSIYDSGNIQFHIVYGVPHGINSKVNFLWFNADKKYDESIVDEIPFDQIEVENGHQKKGPIDLKDYQFDVSQFYEDSNGIVARKSQGVWRVNDLRISETDNDLPSWGNQKKLEDDYHIVKLIYNTENRDFDGDSNDEHSYVELKASGLNTERSIR